MNPRDIAEAARAMQDKLVVWRRDIHRHPELGFEETRTAGLVADELEKLGWKVRRNVAQTGVVGDLEPRAPQGRILLRADMDALPVQETSGELFASAYPGKAHLCGHDAHVAMLLGTAHLLMRHRAGLKCAVRLMFQPCEERTPGGAPRMIEQGVLEGVDRAFAIHVFTNLKSGQWGLLAGQVMAAADALTITVRGRGGHAAAPERCADPVVAAAQAVTALQTIMSRRLRPHDAGVLSICTIHGGEAFNVIPETVTMKGTLRFHNEAARQQAKQLMKEILDGVAQAAGVRIDLTFDASYPATANDPQTIEQARRAVEELFGPGQAVEIDKEFGSEDFSYVVERVPGAMAFLGVGNAQKGATAAHHNPAFKIDEDVLWQGTALLAWMALACRGKE